MESFQIEKVQALTRWADRIRAWCAGANQAAALGSRHFAFGPEQSYPQTPSANGERPSWMPEWR